MLSDGPGPPSGRAATMLDVARDAGVSLKTVSRVINGEETVSPDLVERVRSAADRLGYRRNSVAASLRRGSGTGTLAVITRDMANPFYSAVAAGVVDIADERGHVVFTASSEGEEPRQTRLVEALSAYRPDGFVVTPLEHEDSALRRLVSEGTAVVCVDVPAPRIETDTVLLPNREYSRLAVDAAIRTGAEDVALLFLDRSFATMDERRDGALDALAGRGREVPPDRMIYGIQGTMDATWRARELLEGPRPPQALFCANNQIALGAALAIAEIRSDTVLVCFDDIPLMPLFTFPCIGVRFDPRELGREAMRLLLARRADPGRAPTETVLDAELVSVNI